MRKARERIAEALRGLRENVEAFTEALEGAQRRAERKMRKGVTREDLGPIHEALSEAAAKGVDKETLRAAHEGLETVWRLAVLHDDTRIIMLGGDPELADPHRGTKGPETGGEDAGT